jgi:preprotein translocase subunit SecG
VYTFLTILHVFVCLFLMLVVLLQAGRGGGIGLAFGSGGSQSVFGSSGGANFLTKLTAICAIIFFTNSLALAYLSSQSDSRRLQRIAEKKALAKKAEDANNAKVLSDIEKQREAKAKAEAEANKSEGTGEGTAAEDKAPTDDKAPAAEDGASAAGKAAPGLKLTMPGQAPAAGKLAPELKLEKTEKPAAEKRVDKPAKPPADKKPAAEKAAPADDQPAKPAAARKPAADKPATEPRPAEGANEKPAAE